MKVPLEIGGRIISYNLANFFALIAVPFVIAVISGIIGMFLMNKRKVDARLVVTGHSRVIVLLSKLIVTLIFLVFASIVSLFVVRFYASPEVWGFYALGALLSGAIYSMVGIAVGISLSKIGGIYTILSLPLIDLLMFQNPLVERDAFGGWIEFMPGSHPMQIIVRSSVGLEIPLWTFLKALFYLIAVTFVASLSIYWALRPK